MSRITHCLNPACPNHTAPPPRWYTHFGSYATVAHGTVPRVRCKRCGRTMSAQSFSLFYFAKIRLDHRQVFSRLRAGASLRDIARELGVSRTAISTAVFRLGRQAMAAHAILTSFWTSGHPTVFDGLQSFVGSHDFPVHITTAVDSHSELVIAAIHTVVRRGGVMRPGQARKRVQRERIWSPSRGALSRDISLLVNEIPRFRHHPTPAHPLVIDTDDHPVYRSVITGDCACRFWKTHRMFVHRRTPGTAPRTTQNRLFAVNYLDRLIRHRLKEHTRETIAGGRHAVSQMHRLWVMVYDHNYRQPYRVRHGLRAGTHGERAGIDREMIRRVGTLMFHQRLDLAGVRVNESIRRVWLGDVSGPPVRWRAGQRHARPHPLPAYARADLLRSLQHGQ